MNTYAKFCPNVFVAKCDQQYNKGDITTITSKYGKETEIEIFNLVKEQGGFFFYSFVRTDGLDSQERVKRKVEMYKNAAQSASKKSEQYVDAANEGRDFLALAEPIKIGHHSEKRHRALIERNHKRMDKAVEFGKKAEEYRDKADALEQHVNKIDLSMPESLIFFSNELEKAKVRHQDLKDNPEKREHSFALTYAKKAVNDLEKKVKLAQVLWG
ncbi:DUF3560 domain-containing protein [Pasteurella canis]|uniref:DUF3560 domain-containing protein n=1 Tax=Pasteurella canis TaxID=753 RepID=UPI001328CF4E|nr:DUF3560 domain-containing protein [Pasteurella canis]MXN88563.1 DUF3560 domain-containing protein [Pasteurella canis]